MTYTVSITSQGQISIPAALRRELGLDKTKKALISKQGSKLIVEPIPDLLSMKGALKDRAKKGLKSDAIIKMEEQAWEVAAGERYAKATGYNKGT